MSDGRYSRVYATVWDDPKFSTIIGDDHHFATWLRLLLRADAAWPSSVAIPRVISEESLAELVRVELIDLCSGDTYRIHGLDPERQRRSDHAVLANDRRWHPSPPGTPPSIPAGTPQVVLDHARTSSLSSTSPLELAVPSVEPLLDALMGALGSAVPSKNAMDWADRLSAEYGEDATIRALGNAAVAGPVKVISRAESALKESVIRRSRADAKRKEADTSAAKQDRIAARRAEFAAIPENPRSLSEIMKGMVP